MDLMTTTAQPDPSLRWLLWLHSLMAEGNKACRKKSMWQEGSRYRMQ